MKAPTPQTLQQRERLKKWASDMSSGNTAVRRRAANGLYRALHGPLQYYFLQRLGNFNGQNTYEDLTLVTIEKVFEKIHQYDGTMGEFTTWAYRIALNTLIDERRKFKGYDVVSVEAINAMTSSRQDDGAYFEIPSKDEDQYQMLVHNERQDHILSVIQKMDNKKDAILLLLRFYKNYSYEEIVDETRMPMGTVKASLKRAKEKLAILLESSPILAE